LLDQRRITRHAQPSLDFANLPIALSNVFVQAPFLFAELLNLSFDRQRTAAIKTLPMMVLLNSRITAGI
jgi:hypothetical protein